MSETQKVSQAEPSFKLNYITAILLLVILIPVVYTVVANLQRPEPAPQISPVKVDQSSTPAQSSAGAIEAALKAVAAAPAYNTYINLGLAYYNAAQYPEAIKAWEKALEYNPKGELAYNNIAAAYGNMNNYDAEIEICKRALAINPNLEIAKRNLAWAESQKNKK
jgi:tetratricopeptide (TPR) repeat protein